MNTQVDILENEILEKYPEVLDILLLDHSIKKNITWCTNNYEHLGEEYNQKAQVLPALITGKNGQLIMPRVQKNKILQQSRVKNMAEVFTPSWICNAQNNSVDNQWFGRKNVFNTEKLNSDGLRWETNPQKIQFPENTTWIDYITRTSLEITCGEAPYLVSRYDTTTGDFIPVENRIGLLDRKLRIVHENTKQPDEWLAFARIAYENCYGYEWQGDNLLLARENMLVNFIENYKFKFGEEPKLEAIQEIAYIISWNIWQMDGLKGVVPHSCQVQNTTTTNLFGEVQTIQQHCTGCKNGDIKKHNGIYCLIMNWSATDEATGQKGKKLRFIDLLNN